MTIYIYKGPCDKHTFSSDSWLVTIAMVATVLSPNSQGTPFTTPMGFFLIS